MAILAYAVLLAGPHHVVTCSQGYGVCSVPTSGTWLAWGAVQLTTIGMQTCYYLILDGKRGQTLGRRSANNKLVDARTGEPIGPLRVFGRFLCSILSAIPCYLGYFWMLWDPQKQTWHDKMMGTLVIKA